MSVYPGIDDKLVVRVPGQTGPGYKLQSGSKISFSSTPAGTLQVTKRENGVISTAESSFAGGTLELTDSDILDAKIVDGNGDTLFQLGDMVGDSVFDYKGGLVGTASGNVTPVIRRSVWALEFDGTGYVDCGNGESLDITNNFTLFVDFNPDGDHSPGLMVKGSYDVGFDWPNNNLRSEGWNSLVDFPFCSPPKFGRRNYIVALGDQQLKGYMDGIVQATRTEIGGLLVNTENLVIGKAVVPDSSWVFSGLIHLPIIIYARALSESEIKLLTQRRFDEVSRQDCVLWLDYDPDFYASTGKLKDFSGFGNHGTLNGGCTIKKVTL